MYVQFGMHFNIIHVLQYLRNYFLWQFKFCNYLTDKYTNYTDGF